MTEKEHQRRDGITISESFTEDVPATGAMLTVTVKGSSFVSGQSAMRKAREVASLVEGLKAAGLPEEKISVESVKLQASSGPILKSSSATYTLKLDCDNLEKLDDVLTVVTSAKNISLDELDWQYGDIDDRKNKWINAAITKANSRAKEAASALGVEISGVHKCLIAYIGIQESPVAGNDLEYSAPSMARRRQTFSIGMTMQQSMEKGARVSVFYLITK
ncbi:MAG TPA: SIMPL domain-containing protein [Planktothrix sp.]